MSDVEIYQPQRDSLPAVTAPPGPLEWRAMREQCEVICESGLAPRTLNTPAKILAVMLKGRELAVPPMQALSHIHIVEGKPTLSSEMMRALVRRAGHKIRYKERSNTRCAVEGIRADDPDAPLTVTFTIEDARQAGLLGKDNWKKYPGDMIQARATAILCRALFDDVLMGASYTPEELGAEVDDEGAVVAPQVTVLEAVPDPAPPVVDLTEVQRALAEAAEAGLEGAPDRTLQYAAQSQAHADKAAHAVRKRIAAAAAQTAPAEAAEPDGPSTVGEIHAAERADREAEAEPWGALQRAAHDAVKAEMDHLDGFPDDLDKFKTDLRDWWAAQKLPGRASLHSTRTITDDQAVALTDWCASPTTASVAGTAEPVPATEAVSEPTLASTGAYHDPPF